MKIETFKKLLVLVNMGYALFSCSPSVKFSEVSLVAGLSAVDPTCSSDQAISIPAASLDLRCRHEDGALSQGYFSKGMANFFFPRNQSQSLPHSVPASCLSGFEVNNLTKDTFTFRSAQGTVNDLVLEVDLGTYLAPDSVRITAKDAAGNESIIFDSCHIRTSCYGDPSSGTQRPYEESIRSFRVLLKKGSVSIKLDNSLAETPTYVRVLGLCEFDLQRLPGDAGNTQFRKVSGRSLSAMGDKNPDSDQY